MIEEKLKETIQLTVDFLQRTLPDRLLWMVAPARRTLEYVFGPVLDHPGRFPWWGFVAALTIAAAAYLTERSRVTGDRRAGFLRFCFPREVYRNPSAWVDLKVGFFNYIVFGGGAINLTWRLSTALFASWITVLLTTWLGPREHPATWGAVAVVLLMLALSLASDFGYFLFHWTSHVFPPLWAIHKLHHSAEVMTPLTAARVHPLEHMIMGPFMALTTGLLIGPLLYFYGGIASTPTIFGMDVAAMCFFAFGHNLHHSHVWVYFGPIVGRVIVSPAQHQIHHSSLQRHLDKNFAEHWAIWDTIFGTLYLPQGRESLKLGLAGYQTQPHAGVLAAWAIPVFESAVATLSGIRKLTDLVRKDRIVSTSLSVGPTSDAS
jgi:sterol desaturase/sphingolipid hydroxylase (fatty acid hydroxylase superfamily)